MRRAFVSERAAEIQNMVDAAFPNTRNTVYDCVNNCAQMMVFSQSSQEPGVYYYIANGQPVVIGRQYPQLIDAALGREEFITYPARDGRQIPGILTLPAIRRGTLSAGGRPSWRTLGERDPRL